ncbi:CDP-glycerol glycerophosphotransferase family protein [Rossellomorea marisflavi]|uniref:CDP-glycerol glycerophosphotransferase family protein n=1 Tax=Rossellomorea marisflavi TaxID=189381 RepID=UPI001EE2D23F|nr:CDP-glycerol glycerophosphotransferase family protein [Rossellomorea marisflavi]
MYWINKLKKIRLKDLKSFIKILAAYPLSLLLKPFIKDLWLISERPDDARDNGYYLFKYVRENHPNDNVYYAINKYSKDFKKVSQLGNIIHFGSFKHFFYYFVADKNISSHIGSGEPGGQLCLNLEILGVIKNTKVFLQHGIIKDMLNFALYENTKVNLFVCGAAPEYEYVVKEFGYPENNVKYIGLCRFDGLHNVEVKKNQILIMPTWRQWLDNDIEAFGMSDYLQQYLNLINDKDLDKYLDENDLKIIFYPHDNVQKYIHLFGKSTNNITIAKKNEFDVQELLKESAILITDYSSVFFDFAYMNKPILHYHFDDSKYRQNHYKEGYFNYVRDGFGPVLYNSSDLIKEIKLRHNDNFNLSKTYSKRIKNFFPLHDQRNCARTYEEIRKI